VSGWALLAVERALNGRGTKQAHPEIGEDIKVMGIRRDGGIQLTISCAFVGRYVSSLDDDIAKRAAAGVLAIEAARSTTSLPVEASVNVADDLARGDVFLTVTGTSAEAGDDGHRASSPPTGR
jgi:S-adenosylmethionine synthetase